MSLLPGEQLCRRFLLDEVQSATQNFDGALVIGQGGFGKVYKGTIIVENGKEIVVAIKRLDSSSNQGEPQFWAEIEMLSKLRHCNLVSLIGYCNDSSEMILVYEFMPNGTLYEHLHKYGTGLSWEQRLKISIGAARGLQYLHTGTGTQHGVIHRDVKSSNILLDKDYAAKISDFGLSKIGPTNRPATYVSTLVKGTFGYLDPEYFLTGRLTRKSDVFAFGVVLFELLCGRLAVDTSLDDEQCSLAKWAHECIEEGKLGQIVDSNIKGKIFPECLKVFAQIADRCLHSRSKERPTMAEVVVALELSLSLQENFDNYVQPAGISAFTRKMKGLFCISRQGNSAPSDAKALRSTDDTIKDGPSSIVESDDHHLVLPIEEMTTDVNHVSGGEVISCHTLEVWKEHLEKGKNKLIIVDFFASWCGPCRAIAPFLAELAKKLPSVTFLKVDVDELKELAGLWGVETMPTFFFLKDGEPVDKIVGSKKEELQQAITKHMGSSDNKNIHASAPHSG